MEHQWYKLFPLILSDPSFPVSTTTTYQVVIDSTNSIAAAAAAAAVSTHFLLKHHDHMDMDIQHEQK